MKRKRIALGIIATLLTIGMPAFPHHGGADYDVDHPVTFKGTVTEFYWTNPHVQIFVDVKDDKGKVVNWAVEAYAPAVLKRAGWSPQTLHPGDRITITLATSKRGTPVASLRKVVLPDGKELTSGLIGERGAQ